MAIPISPSMYSGGAVTLDSQPVVNMYAQLLARKQAKNDAMDAYQRDRIGKVNDKGLRDVDRHLFDNSLADIYGSYTTNKEKILKGGNKEAFDYEAKWRTPKEILSKSQVSQATHEAAMKLYNERFKKKDVMPKGFMEELALNDLPVNDPNYKLFDLKKWMEEPPPLNTTAFLKNFSDIEREGVRYEGIPDKPLMQNEIKYFKDKGLDAIRFRAANIRDEDYGFATQIEKEYEDPIGRKKMIDVFTKAYGTPPATMDDYAAAFTLEMLQLEKGTPKENKEATMAQQQANRKEIQAIGQQNAISRIDRIYGYKAQLGITLQQRVDDAYNHDLGYAANHNGEVETNKEKINTIFGGGTGTIKIGTDGSYELWGKDVDGNSILKQKKSANAAKESMMKYTAPVVKPGVTAKPSGNTAPKKEIKRSDIKTKAAAAGYSEKEYEALLKQKGITIIE